MKKGSLIACLNGKHRKLKYMVFGSEAKILNIFVFIIIFITFVSIDYCIDLISHIICLVGICSDTGFLFVIRNIVAYFKRVFVNTLCNNVTSLC